MVAYYTPHGIVITINSLLSSDCPYLSEHFIIKTMVINPVITHHFAFMTSVLLYSLIALMN